MTSQSVMPLLLCSITRPGQESSLRAIVLALAVFGALSSSAGAQTFDERLSVCLACHGEKGQSETPDVPSLGGQPPLYVLIQLYMFRQKLRTSEPMNEMTRDLSDADLQRFADTIAKSPPPQPPSDLDAARAARARELVTRHRCGFCHDADFSGNDSVPRLAAQREDYLLKALREYKAGTRPEYQPIMAEVMGPLQDQDLADLAHFLARVP
jgi:cytochrome c553